MGNFTKDTKISSELTMVQLEGKTDQEVLQKMSQHLYDNGMVKESYIDAVKEREKVYPTGLQCDGIGIAIPHTDSEHVIEQSICIATLKEPVTFLQMGTEDQKVSVSIVFMLGIKNPKQQIDFLQELMTLVEHPEELEKLKNAKNKEEACNQFIQSFETVNRKV